jgi:glycosyltransferase involved in cell wall biosynthesis
MHYHALGPGLATPITRYGSRASIVQTVHGLDDERAKWGAGATRGLRLAQKMSARLPDQTIVVSRALERHYRDRHGRETVYIPNGVGNANVASDERVLDRLGLREHPYVLFVGRLVPEKAVDVLVRAFRDVPGEVRLVVAGPSSFSDSYVGELRALAAGDPRVLLPGAVVGGQLAALYEHATAYSLPSRLEGLPLTLLEAASHGLPLVVSDIAAHREVCGAPGPGVAFVPPGDARALASSLAAVLADPVGARADAQRLQRVVDEQYTWDLAAAATVRVYEAARSGAQAAVTTARPAPGPGVLHRERVITLDGEPAPSESTVARDPAP